MKNSRIEINYSFLNAQFYYLYVLMFKLFKLYQTVIIVINYAKEIVYAVFINMMINVMVWLISN